MRWPDKAFVSNSGSCSKPIPTERQRGGWVGWGSGCRGVGGGGWRGPDHEMMHHLVTYLIRSIRTLAHKSVAIRKHGDIQFPSSLHLETSRFTWPYIRKSLRPNGLETGTRLYDICSVEDRRQRGSFTPQSTFPTVARPTTQKCNLLQ